MPEIEVALRIIYGARYVKKYDQSKVLLEIVDWLECYNVLIFEEFCEEEYQGLKGQEHHDLTEVFMNANEDFLTECAEIMHYPHDVSNANKEKLAKFLANIMLNQRKLGKIYHGEYDDVYYEGTLEELPEEIQLFIKLTE